MADYSREIAQALREIAQEMRNVRRTLEGIDRRLAVSGGLTNALTRRAHLVEYDGNVHCSACGMVHGEWLASDEEIRMEYGEQCEYCGAIFCGEKEVAFK